MNVCLHKYVQYTHNIVHVVIVLFDPPDPSLFISNNLPESNYLSCVIEHFDQTRALFETSVQLIKFSPLAKDENLCYVLQNLIFAI